MPIPYALREKRNPWKLSKMAVMKKLHPKPIAIENKNAFCVIPFIKHKIFYIITIIYFIINFIINNFKIMCNILYTCKIYTKR